MTQKRDLIDVGRAIVEHICGLADEGSDIDTGCGMGQFDINITIDGVEYKLLITADDEPDMAEFTKQ